MVEDGEEKKSLTKLLLFCEKPEFFTAGNSWTMHVCVSQVKKSEPGGKLDGEILSEQCSTSHLSFLENEKLLNLASFDEYSTGQYTKIQLVAYLQILERGRQIK